MDIRQYLDATYLKTPQQVGLTQEQNQEVVRNLVDEAVQENYKLVMVRPDMVAIARRIIDVAGSGVLVGTVISFPEGNASLKEKLEEAGRAIVHGADELDFVVDYVAFIDGNTEKVEAEVKQGTALCLEIGKTVKWIIEIAALTDVQIAAITTFIKNVVVSGFNENDYGSIFVKSSTGFYKTQDGKPNGATPQAIRIMLDNAGPLPVKAAGGVRNYEEAVAMVNMGVKRIGTSAAKQIVDGGTTTGGY